MKKSLMILASVALGASLATAEDVTSQNVVGFYGSSLVQGQWQQAAIQFDKIGGTNNTLADLPFDPNIFSMSGIQVAYNDGDLLLLRSYTCYSEDPLGPDPEFGGGRPAGWYDGDFNYAGDVEIPAGTGFWLVPSATTNVSYKGEVIPVDVQVTFASGKWKMLCNPFPMAIQLKDLPFSPATWFNTGIQVAYNDGDLVLLRSYTCYSEDPLGPDPEFGGGRAAGWYDGDFGYAGEVELPVGQGFWVNPATDGTLTFQSPL